jgi:hypothetical protein
MFRTVLLSIIRSTSLYTQQWYMSYRFADSLRAGTGWNSVPSWSCLQAVRYTGMTYIIAVCTVKYSWRWTEELSETNRASFQNKTEKLVHLVGFIIRNARIVSRCTVTWRSNSDTAIVMQYYCLQQQQYHLSDPSYCRYSCPKLFTQQGSEIQSSSPPTCCLITHHIHAFSARIWRLVLF